MLKPGLCAQEGLFEEAGLLREREVDMKVRLGGLPHEAPQVPCVTLADVESVLSAWTGIPPERMGQDDRDRLALMEPALKARSLESDSYVSSLCPTTAVTRRLPCPHGARPQGTLPQTWQLSLVPVCHHASHLATASPSWSPP